MLTAVDQENQVSNQGNGANRQEILQIFVVCSIEDLAGGGNHFFKGAFGCKDAKRIRTESKQFVRKREMTE